MARKNSEAIEEELRECREKLEVYKQRYSSLRKLEISVQDPPFRKTDEQLSKKYFDSKLPLLETALYRFLNFDMRLQKEGILTDNSIDIYLPPVEDNLNELEDFWKKKGQKERTMLVQEYLKLIAFSNHFKIKQLIGSLFSLINNRRLLSTLLICRALFEHVSVLNSYYELYKTLVKSKNSTPTFQKFEKEKITRGDLSESFEEPFKKLRNIYKGIESEFIFCVLCHRYLYAGRADLGLYEKHGNDWNTVFKASRKLEFEPSRKLYELNKGIASDITFLENKIQNAKKWYSIICEFVHPNAGSHRAVIFKRIHCTKKNGEDIELPYFNTLREENRQHLKKEMDVFSKYRLCSISSYDIEQSYAFVVEATYSPLIQLISLFIEIIEDLLKEAITS